MDNNQKEINEKDRRKFKRVEVKLRITYTLKGESGETSILSADISAGGARVWLNKLIKKDSLIEIKAYISGGKEVITCAGKVVWQSQRPEKAEDGKFYYQTGVQFEEMDLKERMKLIYYCHNVDKARAHQ